MTPQEARDRWTTMTDLGRDFSDAVKSVAPIAVRADWILSLFDHEIDLGDRNCIREQLVCEKWEAEEPVEVAFVDPIKQEYAELLARGGTT